MNISRLLCVSALGLISALLPGVANAQAAETATQPGVATTAASPVGPRPVNDTRWSLWPTVGVMLSDKADRDAGFSAGLKATRPLTDHILLDLGADYGKLGTENAGDYERISLRLGASLFGGTPFYDQASDFQPFLSLGAHASAVDFLNQNTSAFGPYAGVGFLQRLGSWTMLSLEARYQIDLVQEKGPLPESDFYTWQLLAGLRIPLGEKPYDRHHDSDRDGVPDGRDRCPGTPPGMRVGPDGCPLDSDDDGVPDHRDACPGTPPGVRVDARGCPPDTDGDGVPDHLDRCPRSAAGSAVDADGCPQAGPDSDGDGVPDHLDECARTPLGAKVLPTGCALTKDCRTPRPGEAADARGCALDRNFILRGVKFEFDSDRLTPEARSILNEVATTLQAYPDLNVDLEGHTDSIGSDTYNLGLSERRSNAVKSFLVDRGVRAQRMTPVGYGESRPIDSNETEAGRENNRRVELKVLD